MNNRLKFVLILCIAACGIGLYYFLPRTKKQPLEIPSEISPGLIQKIEDVNDFEKLMKDDGPLVIKFYAPWCGACQYVDNYLPLLAQSFENTVNFYAVNTDNKTVMNLIQESHITKESINYLPTFVLIQTGKIYKQLEGAKEFHELQQEIKQTFDLLAS